MSIRIESRVGVALPEDDVFQNKATAWNFAVPRPSAHVEAIKPQGRFAIAPMDHAVVEYLEDQLASNLPVAHLYDGALSREIESLADFPQAQAILLAHQQERDYFMARKNEQVIA